MRVNSSGTEATGRGVSHTFVELASAEIEHLPSPIVSHRRRRRRRGESLIIAIGSQTPALTGEKQLKPKNRDSTQKVKQARRQIPTILLGSQEDDSSTRNGQMGDKMNPPFSPTWLLP